MVKSKSTTVTGYPQVVQFRSCLAFLTILFFNFFCSTLASDSPALLERACWPNYGAIRNRMYLFT